MKIKINEIDFDNRIRKYWDKEAFIQLKESINKIGLLHPITINQNNKLLAGYRRMLACKELGWKEIEANVVNTKNNSEEILIELEENIQRNNLSKSELAKGLALYKEAYEQEHPETKVGKHEHRANQYKVEDIKSNTLQEPAERYTKVIAKETGIPEATIQKRVREGKKILEEEKETGKSETAEQLDKPKPRGKSIVKPKEVKKISKCPYCNCQVGITDDLKLVKV